MNPYVLFYDGQIYDYIKDREVILNQYHFTDSYIWPLPKPLEVKYYNKYGIRE